MYKYKVLMNFLPVMSTTATAASLQLGVRDIAENNHLPSTLKPEETPECRSDRERSGYKEAVRICLLWTAHSLLNASKA